jgi:hypothetical protein
MGSEARCKAHAGGKAATGKALLETDEIVFRGGELRFAIAYKDMRSVAVDAGELVIETGAGEVRFELGPLAAKWAEKIRNPRSLMDKLGLKAGQRVALIGLEDESFEAEVRTRCTDVSVGKAKGGSNVVFLGVAAKRDLARIATIARSLEPAGALWVVRPKGRPEPSESQVMEAGRAAGLVDVKVVRFSATHTAEKFVIPVARRR